MKKTVLYCVQDNSCCGCGACVNICPVGALSYGEDQYGFIVPEMDSNKCIDCGKCLQVCPAINHISNDTIFAYAGVNKDPGLLTQSSSGGIFFEFAKHVLEQNGLVIGCTMDENFNVKHVEIDAIENLKKIMKSKYVQSHMGDIYKKIKAELVKDKTVLFCGTPCQVSAVKNYVGQKQGEKLITVDIVCHGVPSQRFFNDYIANLERERNKRVSFYTFRYKRNGRQGMNWHSAYKYAGSDKVIVKNWPEDSFNYLYMTSAIYRESCYGCKYAKADRVGDITLCDYWGWNQYHNEFSCLDPVSAILVNTERGLNILKNVKDKNSITLIETNVDNVRSNNGCLRTPVIRNGAREEILNTWIKDGYAVINENFKVSHWKQILKYSVMRHIPPRLLYLLKRG